MLSFLFLLTTALVVEGHYIPNDEVLCVKKTGLHHDNVTTVWYVEECERGSMTHVVTKNGSWPEFEEKQKKNHLRRQEALEEIRYRRWKRKVLNRKRVKEEPVFMPYSWEIPPYIWKPWRVTLVNVSRYREDECDCHHETAWTIHQFNKFTDSRKGCEPEQFWYTIHMARLPDDDD